MRKYCNRACARSSGSNLYARATDANPTALEVLWAPPAIVLHRTPAADILHDGRALFLSRRVANSFGTYALSQLKRIKTHRRWLLEPPQIEPTRAAFGLPERTLIDRDQLGAADALTQQGVLEEEELSPNFLRVLHQERNYRAARREWQQ